MFDIGFWELLVIGVVALLVVGPERLPGVARTAGRWVGQVQRFVRNARADIQRELEADNLKSLIDQQEKQIHELRSIVQSSAKDSGLDGLEREISESVESLGSDLETDKPAAAAAKPAPAATTPPAAAGASARPAEPGDKDRSDDRPA